MTSGFSQEDQVVIQKAKSDLSKADRLYQKSQQIYNQYKPLLENRRRRKRRRGERKSIAGKITLKQAAFFYDKAYSALFTTYFNYAQNLKFQLSQNTQKAQQLLRDAERKFNLGQKMLKKMQNYTEKELKKKIQFKTMFRDVDNGKGDELKAVQELIQIINLFNSESDQLKAMQRRDDSAWNQALSENTIDAYQQYLANFSNGRHILEAKAKIDQLRQQQQNAVDTTILDYTTTPNVDLVYRIQILSDIKPWTANKIRSKIYPSYGVDGKPTFQAQIGGRYKYFIGEFKSYKPAKRLAMTLRRTVRTKPFVVAFLNGEPIDILQAIAIEKQAKHQ